MKHINRYKDKTAHTHALIKYLTGIEVIRDVYGMFTGRPGDADKKNTLISNVLEKCKKYKGDVHGTDVRQIIISVILLEVQSKRPPVDVQFRHQWDDRFESLADIHFTDH